MIDQFTEAFEGIRRSHEAGRLGHAYLIIGAPQGEGRALAEATLRLLYCMGKEKPCGTCEGCAKATTHEHPDVHWLEPESKSRVITINEMRALVRTMTQTSFAGGWKAAVILEADRLNDDSANTFLKTLEEPTKRTLFLLVSAAPQSILPTIVSRCQRVLVDTRPPEPAAELREAVLAILRRSAAGSVLDGVNCAAGIKVLLDEEKKKIAGEEKARAEREHLDVEDETIEARTRARYIDFRTGIVRLIEAWHRDVLFCATGADPGLLQLPGERAALERHAQVLGYGGALAAMRAVLDLQRQLVRLTPLDYPPFEAFFSGRVTA